MPLHPDITLLAPVPLVHLAGERGGEYVCAHKGKVALGSRAWEFFRALDEDRNGLEVETFVYASHSDARDLSVTWHARYVGHVEGVNGVHPDGRRYRPKSTIECDGEGWWAVFWEVAGLERLAEPMPIAELCAYGTGEPYGKGFVPEGPMRVGCVEW